MDRRNGYRAGLALLLLASVAVVAAGAVGSTSGGTMSGEGFDEGTTVAPPRGGITVVATDSNSWLGRESEGPRANAELFAVGSDGRVLYYNDTHTRYWDVDPVPRTNATVEYVYADHLDPEECGGESVCTRNGVERVNLTTGNVTHVFSRVTPGKHSTRWHDVDRLNESRLVVADISEDRVFVVDTRTGIVEWSWNAQSEFDVADSGGPYPSDWTHLNDVEVLDDGRLMVSMRNHDQVVFLDRETGLVENWTLGADDRHEVLYEQHNPDYLPAERGGPSVLVADSENNRIVEYHRENGSNGGTWARTWTWRDEQLAWARDADRLPDGHTLVTDSNGNRVLEVAENGTVVWEMDVAFPYEAERLGTGDESTGGPARSAGGNASGDGPSAGTTTPAGEPANSGLWAGLRSLTSGPTVNAVRYVLPVWMGTLELFAAIVAALTAVAWLAAEIRWAPFGLSVRSPIGLERRR